LDVDYENILRKLLLEMERKFNGTMIWHYGDLLLQISSPAIYFNPIKMCTFLREKISMIHDTEFAVLSNTTLIVFANSLIGMSYLKSSSDVIKQVLIRIRNGDYTPLPLSY